MSDYFEFHKYYTNLPEILEWIDKGINVTETFIDHRGDERFVWNKTNDDYISWKEKNNGN